MSHHCPALLISASSSGQGKTTVTAALARYHRNQGRKVRVFKTGPDFLDPMILEQASGSPVYQLDLWMGGAEHCQSLLHEAAADADLILIEGVMGLFDGTTSSADLAKQFNIPVLAVIDSTAMAQTFGAIAYGLANYDTALPFWGVVANRVASDNHRDMLQESMAGKDGLSLVASLARSKDDNDFSLPSRHLGLHQANEIENLDARLDRAAQALQFENETLPAPVEFTKPDKDPLEQLLLGKRIAVARDQAFSFIYRANLDLLQKMGAELRFFSPLKDSALPEADSIYLPGGYPELFLSELAANESLKKAIRAHADANKPIVAECGGMLYLLDSLTDKQGQQAQMLGILPGDAVMQGKLSNLGLHSAPLPEGDIRGHTYHHSSMQTELEPVGFTQPTRKRGKPEALLRSKQVRASYLHLYLPSNPEAGARLFS